MASKKTEATEANLSTMARWISLESLTATSFGFLDVCANHNAAAADGLDVSWSGSAQPEDMNDMQLSVIS